MKTVILTITVHAETDETGAGRIERKLQYAADVLASDGMLSPDDMELDSWEVSTRIVR